MYAGVLSQAFPPLAALYRKSAVPAHRWIAGGCLVSILGDAVSLPLALQGVNNMWIGYLSTPLMGAAFLLGMASWQATEVERLAVRLAVPAYLAAWTGLVLFTESVTGFSRFAMPLHSLIVLAVAIWTLMRRGLDPMHGTLLRTDWFWIVGGVALYGAATATFEPVAAGLMTSRQDLVIAALNLKQALYLIAFLAMTWGMLCPVKPFGASSSSPRSA